MIFPPWRAFLCLHLPIAKNMKVITVKTLQEDEEMKTLQCLHFPSFTHGVMTYILAIIIIMFIYSGIVVIWDPWILICHPPVSFVICLCHFHNVGRQIKIREPQVTTVPSKWTLLLYDPESIHSSSLKLINYLN